MRVHACEGLSWSTMMVLGVYYAYMVVFASGGFGAWMREGRGGEKHELEGQVHVGWS